MGKELEDQLTKIRFSVFKNVKDRDEWSKHIEYAEKRIDISEEERKLLINSLQFLEQELGTSFFKNAIGSHPIVQQITSFFDEIIEFSDNLKKLKANSQNMSFLIKEKLIPNKACWREGRHFFDISSYFIGTGLIVNFLEEDSIKKAPDLEIINSDNNDSFYVEITTMNEDEKRLKKRKIHDYLWYNCFDYPPRIPYSCKVLNDLDDKELTGLKSIISNLKTEVVESKGLAVFSDNNIQIAMANQSNIEVLKSWAKKYNNSRLEITGLSFQYNDTTRIANNKIRKKAKQIPSDKTGLLYVYVEPLYLITADLYEIVEQFQKKMRGIKNLFGIVIYSKIIHDVKDIYLEELGDFYSNKMINKRLSRELLFVFNNDCQTNLKKETIEKVYKSFR